MSHAEHAPKPNALVLRTPRLELHPLTESDRDAALMLAVLNDPDFVHHVRDSGVRDLEQARAAVRTGPMVYRQANGLGMCRVTETGTDRDLGQIGIVTRDWLPGADLGYGFLPMGRGQGYAVEAGRAVLDYARRVLALPCLLAIVSPANAPSQAVLGKLGFGFETMTQLPGTDKALQLYSIDLQKDP
ncbi:Protein N-acetyltransferase, RimJ/RimL family [Pseudoxanthomonas sp. GM95]|uniref:GNAT family N-acetyltransferase n=1 Tax=Pseudoxanthomonas sp. GM95 TaxID=1881043 RepID=UPI0008B24358|nr:GNAT family N-acetyltransferase [Pseudoxanthomonas sp. GM95]SEK73225.1 Protein N-acetyltransferase, RimJ/RimL family [Pseudoxanthomonas sp. GM95]